MRVQKLLPLRGESAPPSTAAPRKTLKVAESDTLRVAQIQGTHSDSITYGWLRRAVKLNRSQCRLWLLHDPCALKVVQSLGSRAESVASTACSSWGRPTELSQ